MVNDGGIDKIVSMEADAWQSTLRRVTLSMNRPFVLSLSGPSDARVQHSGLLSQWRGYGSDGGYALVLDTRKLEAMLADEALCITTCTSIWATSTITVSICAFSPLRPTLLSMKRSFIKGSPE